MPGRLTEARWDPDLAVALAEHAVAVPEERVASVLPDDLAGISPDEGGGADGGNARAGGEPGDLHGVGAGGRAVKVVSA